MKKYVLLFKTHLWNETISRNFELCKQNFKKGDIYIVYDNSNGEVDIPLDILAKEYVYFTPYQKIEDLNLEYGMPSPEDGVTIIGGYWYNGDYQQNLFILDHPEYDYICSVENDVSVLLSIDKIFENMEEDKVDVVFYPQEWPNNQWSHLGSCVGYYDVEQYINKGLFCISFFSLNAAFLILKRRLEMSVFRRKENIQAWPIGEALMAHEPILNNMSVRPLQYYCSDLSFYDWSPAYTFSEVKDVAVPTVIHPVTEINRKFIISNFVRDYNSLFSENNVVNKTSLKRVKAIKDMEVYCRLFNSVHVQWSEDRWLPILESLEEELPSDVSFFLKGRNILDTNNIVSEHMAIPTYLCGELPVWDLERDVCFPVGSKLEIKLSHVSQKNKLIFCSFSADIDTKIAVTWEKGEKILQKIGKYRELYFFELNCNDLEFFTLEFLEDVYVDHIRLVN